MRWMYRYIFIIGTAVGSLSATSVLSCSFNGNAFTSSGCYTSPTFYTTTTTDWLAALGPANTGAQYIGASGAWQHTNADGVTISLAEGPGYMGDIDSLMRVDNFSQYFDTGTNTWRAANAAGSPYSGYNTVQSYFNAAPGSGAGTPGDHLIERQGSTPLEIQFSQGLSGVMFRISTPTSSDVVATISAYAQLNPGTNDTPLMTYTVHATSAGGVCTTLASGPPIPCNYAPYLGIEGLSKNIHSVVVNTSDSGGFYFGSLYLDYGANPFEEAPEPGTFALFGGALVALVATSRRRALRRG